MRILYANLISNRAQSINHFGAFSSLSLRNSQIKNLILNSVCSRSFAYYE